MTAKENIIIRLLKRIGILKPVPTEELGVKECPVCGEEGNDE